VELARTDAMSEISTYSTVLPIGLTADLTGVPRCPQADIEQARGKTGMQEEQSPSCPGASLIGHSLVGPGVGAILDYEPGELYLSGPFRGDPLSVVSITSAVVGPLDLGTVVVRFGLHSDPYTAQVSIDPSGSEPTPTIIGAPGYKFKCTKKFGTITEGTMTGALSLTATNTTGGVSASFNPSEKLIGGEQGEVSGTLEGTQSIEATGGGKLETQ
jgi:hypothetical protein